MEEARGRPNGAGGALEHVGGENDSAPIGRTLPDPTPGPTIRRTRAGRPNGASRTANGAGAHPAAGEGLTPKQQRDRARRARAPASPAPARPPGKPVAERLRQAHDTAARRLQCPELALSADESRDVADALGSLQELTGFVPAGPFWTWLTVFWVLGTTYGGRFADIAARRRLQAAQTAAQTGQAALAPPAAAAHELTPHQAAAETPITPPAESSVPASPPMPGASLFHGGPPLAPPIRAAASSAPFTTAEERLGPL